MLIVRGNKGKEKKIFKTDIGLFQQKFEQEVVKYLLELDFPGFAIHIRRSIDDDMGNCEDDYRLECTILMRPFGRYASLGWNIEDGKLDANWSPALNNYIIGTFDIPVGKKLDKKAKKEISHQIKGAIKEVVATVKIYQKYKPK